MKLSSWKKTKTVYLKWHWSVIKSADDYADKTEKLHDLTHIAKSNSLRRAPKDKDNDLKSVSDQLEAASLPLEVC